MSTIPQIRTAPRRSKAKSDLSIPGWYQITVLILLISMLIAQLFTLGLALVGEFRYQEQRRAAQEMIEHFQSLQSRPGYDWEAEQERLEREHDEVFKAIQECFDGL